MFGWIIITAFPKQSSKWLGRGAGVDPLLPGAVSVSMTCLAFLQGSPLYLISVTLNYSAVQCCTALCMTAYSGPPTALSLSSLQWPTEVPISGLHRRHFPRCRTEQSRAEQSRAEQSRALLVDTIKSRQLHTCTIYNNRPVSITNEFKGGVKRIMKCK